MDQGRNQTDLETNEMEMKMETHTKAYEMQQKQF